VSNGYGAMRLRIGAASAFLKSVPLGRVGEVWIQTMGCL